MEMKPLIVSQAVETALLAVSNRFRFLKGRIVGVVCQSHNALCVTFHSFLEDKISTKTMVPKVFN